MYMYTLGAGRILIKSIIIVCYWHGRLAGLTEQVKMKKKEDNDKIKKSRSKLRAPVIGHAGTHKSPHLAGDFSFLSRVMRKPVFACAKSKAQTSCLITAQLICALVFATLIHAAQSLYFINSKFQASSNLLWLYNLVCVRPGRKHRI